MKRLSIFGPSVCLFAYLSPYLLVCLSIRLSIRLSVRLSVILSVCFPVCFIAVGLSVFLSLCLSVCLSVILLVCVHPSVFPVCLSIYLSIGVSLSVGFPVSWSFRNYLSLFLLSNLLINWWNVHFRLMYFACLSVHLQVCLSVCLSLLSLTLCRFHFSLSVARKQNNINILLKKWTFIHEDRLLYRSDLFPSTILLKWLENLLP